MKKFILLLLFYFILLQTKSTAQSVQLSDSAITSRLYYSGLYMDKFVKGYYNGLAIAATGSFISILSQVVYPPKLDNSL